MPKTELESSPSVGQRDLDVARESRSTAEKHLQLLITISSELISIRPLNDILFSIARLMVETAGFDHASIALFDNESNVFVVDTEYPILARPIRGRIIPAAGSDIQRQILNGNTIIATEVERHPIFIESPQVAELARELNIKSELILPMMSKGKVIGTIGLDAIGETRVYTNEDIDICRAIANQAAVAIENSRLFERSQKYEAVVSVVSAKTLTDNLVQNLTFIDYDRMSVQLITSNRRTLLGGYGFDLSAASSRMLTPVDQDPLVGEVVRHKRVLVIPDTTKCCQWDAKVTGDVRSWIAVPLILPDDSVIGLVTLDHLTPCYYSRLTDSQRMDLEKFAHTAAISVHHAYLVNEASQRAEAYNAIKRITEILNTELDQDRLLDAVMGQIGKSLELRNCFLYLNERNGGSDRLYLHTQWESSGRSAQFPEGKQPVSKDDIVYSFLKNANTSIIEDIATGGVRFPGESLRKTEARSVMATALYDGDRALGAILATDQKPDHFTDRHRLLLDALAKPIAMAIARDKGLSLVHRITQDIIKVSEVTAIAKRIVTGAIELTGMSSGVIYLFDKEHTQITARYVPEGSYHPEPRFEDDSGITREILRRKTIWVIPDIRREPKVNPVLLTSFRSMIAVPLLHDDEIIGILYLNGVQVRGCTSMEELFLSMLASQAAALIGSAAFYHSLLDNMPQHIFLKDRSLRFLWANHEFLRLHGKLLEDIVGKTDEDIYPSDLAKRYRQADLEAMKSAEPMHWQEQYVVPKSGAGMMVELVRSRVLNAEGNLFGVEGVFWDITKEHETRQEKNRLLEASEKEVRIKAALLDEQRQTGEVQKRLIDLMAHTPPSADIEELLLCFTDEIRSWPGVLQATILQPNSAEQYDVEGCSLIPLPLRGKLTSLDAPPTSSLTILSSSLVAIPIEAEHSKPSYIVVKLNDNASPMACDWLDMARLIIRSLYRMGQLLKETERLASYNEVRQTAEFVGAVSRLYLHEAINGVKAIQEWIQMTPPGVPNLAALRESVAELHQQVKEVLSGTDFSKVRPVVCILNEVVEKTLYRLGFRNGKKIHGCELRLNITGHKQKRVSIDPGSLVPILHNLVLNAQEQYELHGKHGPIEISLATREIGEQQYIGVEVKDYAVGIPAENYEKIYQPGFSTKPNGHGLGLWGVRKLVEACSGNIVLDSTFGHYAKFGIFYPVID